MNLSRESKVESREQKCRHRPRFSGARLSTLDPRRLAFTLIEIMIVVAIMAIILSISIPSIYQQLHQDSIRKAVKDLTDACFEARSAAIMSGRTAELSIKLSGVRSVSVTLTGQTSDGYVGGDDSGGAPSAGGGGTVFSANFSEHLTGIVAETFKAADRELENEMICKFYANGTCDPMRVEIQSDHGETRVITTDVITGIADVEVIK